VADGELRELRRRWLRTLDQNDLERWGWAAERLGEPGPRSQALATLATALLTMIWCPVCGERRHDGSVISPNQPGLVWSEPVGLLGCLDYVVDPVPGEARMVLDDPGPANQGIYVFTGSEWLRLSRVAPSVSSRGPGGPVVDLDRVTGPQERVWVLRASTGQPGASERF